MNKDREYFYKIIGLRAGATPKEIKSAFRQLAKLYHPDRNQSPDAQVLMIKTHHYRAESP